MLEVIPLETPKNEVSWSKYRDKFLSLVPRNSLILDLGANSGADSAYFHDHKHKVISADIKIPTLKRSISNPADKIAADMLSLPISANSLDAVWFANTYIFASNEESRAAILSQIFNKLRPGGILFLCDNYFPTSTDIAVHTAEHTHEYLINSGFNIVLEDTAVVIPEKSHYTDDNGTFHVVLCKKPAID